MAYIERKLQILKLLNEKDACSIHYLSKHLYVSPSTLRRDLINMEEEGIICRHHGGISLPASSSSEDSATRRKMLNQDKKMAIARLALSYVREGMVLFLDSSSTVSYLCPFLKQFHNLTIVTNGLVVAQTLNNSAGIKCYLCPGLLKPRSTSIVGEHSREFLCNFHADAVFFSCKAINNCGLFEGDDQQAMVKRNMLSYAGQKYLLCDSTKELTSGYFRLTELSAIDCIISNAPFSETLMETLHAVGCSFTS